MRLTSSKLDESIDRLKMGVPAELYHHVWVLINEIDTLRRRNDRLESERQQRHRQIAALSTIETVSSISSGDIVLREINRIARRSLR